MTRTTHEMARVHEEYLAGLIDARKMRGSGNQFNGQMDVRNDSRRQNHALAVDGKSTFGKSITVTLAMLRKAEEQAHAEQPALALRWYADETLRHTEDWMLIQADFFQALLMDARSYRDMSHPLPGRSILEW